jgi:hypothetical protein
VARRRLTPPRADGKRRTPPGTERWDKGGWADTDGGAACPVPSLNSCAAQQVGQPRPSGDSVRREGDSHN